MAASSAHIIRRLRVVFTAAEMESLQANKEFAAELGKCDESPEAIKKLVTLGGGILSRDANHSRRKGGVAWS